MNKRILIASTLALVASLIGINTNNTYADDCSAVTTYATLKSCVESAPDNEPITIKLGSDMNIGEQITLSANKNITIDGQNHTLTQTADYLGSFIYSNSANSSSLTIQNLTLHGAAGEWSAWWDTCTETDYYDKEYEVPCIKDSVNSYATYNLFHIYQAREFSLDNVVIENFISSGELIQGGSEKADIINSVFRKNNLYNQLFDISPIGDNPVLNFVGNTISENYSGYQLLAIDNGWKEVSFRNNEFSNNWISGSRLFSISIESDAARSMAETKIINNNTPELFEVYGDCSEEGICSIFSMSNSEIFNNIMADEAYGAELQDINVSFAGVQIKNNKIIADGQFGLTSVIHYQSEAVNIKVDLKNTQIMNNSVTVGALVDSEAAGVPLPVGGGLTILAVGPTTHMDVTVDNDTRIVGNSASTKGFGDDLAIISYNKISDNVTMRGFENIANWYLDNAGDRYNPASPVAFTDFTKLDTHSFKWSPGDGYDYYALGLKAIVSEPSPEHNPNTVDNFTIITMISIFSATILAGISLKTVKARR